MDDDSYDQEDSVEDFIDEDDILEVIELDDNPNDENDNSEELVNDMDDMVLDEEGDMVQAGAGVLMDDAEIVFGEHKGSVFCAHVSTDGSQVVTGGEDDLAYVWNITDGQIRFKCEGHTDSVIAAAFNRNSCYVATADMSGLVKIWSTDDGKLILAVESSDIEWLLWHDLTDVVLVGTADGAVWMWRVPSGDCKIYQGPDCACSCGKITPDGKNLVTGYADGTVRVWDLRSVTVIYSTSVSDSHHGPVTSLDIHPRHHIIVTSSVDASAKIINYQSKKVIRDIDCSVSPKNQPEDGATSPDHQQDESRLQSLECARFSSELPYLALCSLDGRLIIWDISNECIRFTCQHTVGIVTCIWACEEPYTNIYTCTLDGLIHCWDVRSGMKIRQWEGHQADILSLSITSNGSRLVSTSDDGTARVFNTRTDTDTDTNTDQSTGRHL